MYIKDLDQGTIIYGIRSTKYPDNKCYGIIITASCDIANRKTSKLYYIVGVAVDEWFVSFHGFYKTYIKQMSRKAESILRPYSIEVDTLLNFDLEESNKVIETYVKDKSHKKEILGLINNFIKYKNANANERKDLIKNNPKPIFETLKQINRGEELHYYYLPEESYISHKGGEKIFDKGLIIDLQEIGMITYDDAQVISNTGIDYCKLSTFDCKTRKRYKELFWLNNNDDFVISESRIGSPWREHLMQRFSHGFVRIGLDGATDIDLNKIKDRLAGK